VSLYLPFAAAPYHRVDLDAVAFFQLRRVKVRLAAALEALDTSARRRIQTYRGELLIGDEWTSRRTPAIRGQGRSAGRDSVDRRDRVEGVVEDVAAQNVIRELPEGPRQHPSPGPAGPFSARSVTDGRPGARPTSSTRW
jgi:hypothetical protein